MDRYYSTDGMNVYLVLQHTAYMDTYETRMLQNNSISGLLSFDLISIDGEMIPCYNVSNLKEFGVASALRLEPDVILRMLRTLFDTINRFGDYLLSGNNLVLQEDSVFCDEAMEHFYFIYLPGYQMGVRRQMQTLMDACIQRMQHTDREQTDRIYQVYQKISEENADIKALQNEVEQPITKQKGDDEMDGSILQERSRILDDAFQEDLPEKEATVKRSRYRMYKILLFAAMALTALCGAGWTAVQYKNYGALEQPRFLMAVCMFLAAELFVYVEIEKKGPAYEKEGVCEELLAEGDAAGNVASIAVVNFEEELTPADTVTLYTNLVEYSLIPADSFGDDCLSPCGGMQLPHAQVTIGRGKKSDYCLGAPSVSRLHAKISWTHQGYVLEDMNSTNGTFVNGYPLRPYFPVILTAGDRIAFGKEIFELRETESTKKTDYYEEENYVKEK